MELKNVCLRSELVATAATVVVAVVVVIVGYHSLLLSIVNAIGARNSQVVVMAAT